MKFSKCLFIFLLLFNYSYELRRKYSSKLYTYLKEDKNSKNSDDTKEDKSNLKISTQFHFPESHKIRLEVFLDLFSYSLFSLNKGEAIEIFNIMDKTHKGEISQNDWDDFVKIYILPFELCDDKNKYLLDSSQLKKCFKNQPTSKTIKVPENMKDKFFDYLIDLLSFNKFDKAINFYSYLLLRLAMFNWEECNTDIENLTFNSFKCAIYLTNRKGYIDEVSLEQVFDDEKRHYGFNSLGFLSYIKVVGTLNIFNNLRSVRDKYKLEKLSFKKSLKENSILSEWTDKEIDYYYKIITEQPMDFRTFFFFFQYYRLFNVYSKGKIKINKEEIVKIIDDLFFPIIIRKAIDSSVTNFKKEEYKEQLPLNKFEISGEKKYTFSFRQKENKADNNNGTNTNDNINRKIFFTTQCETSECSEISRLQFIRLMVHSVLYENLCIDLGKNILKAEDISNYDTESILNHFIPLKDFDRIGMDIINDLPKNLEVDILLYNTIMSLDSKIKPNTEIVDLNFKNIVNELNGMKEFPLEPLNDIYSPMTNEIKLGIFNKIFTTQGRCASLKRKSLKTKSKEKDNKKEKKEKR